MGSTEVFYRVLLILIAQNQLVSCHIVPKHFDQLSETPFIEHNPTGKNFASCGVKRPAVVCDPDHLLKPYQIEFISPKEDTRPSETYYEDNPLVFFLIQNASRFHHGMAVDAMQASVYADDNWKLQSGDLEFMYSIYFHPNNTRTVFGYRSKRLADLETNHQDLTTLAASPLCHSRALVPYIQCLERVTGKFLKFLKTSPGGYEGFGKFELVRDVSVVKKAELFGVGIENFILLCFSAFFLGIIFMAVFYRCCLFCRCYKLVKTVDDDF